MKPPAEMTNRELAEAYLQYVILHQQANVEKRLELVLRRAEIKETHDALNSEIKRRGKKWQIGIGGNVWLE